MDVFFGLKLATSQLVAACSLAPAPRLLQLAVHCAQREPCLPWVCAWPLGTQCKGDFLSVQRGGGAQLFEASRGPTVRSLWSLQLQAKAETLRGRSLVFF